MKLDSCITSHTKINTKWIKHLKVRPESVKLLEENIGKKLFGVGLENGFWDLTPIVQATKAKINYWDYIKNKKFPYNKRKNKTKK